MRRRTARSPKFGFHGLYQRRVIELFLLVMNIPKHLFSEIGEHSESAYPEECCGVVLAKNNSPDQLIRVHRCSNAQDQFHELDPIRFPRTNRNAYFIDPKDLLAIERECREREERVRVIYHSHPDAGAYFSEEDQRCAVVDGEPLHSGVDYLVVSVRDKNAGASALFEWNAASKRHLQNGER
jgi:proteasome lid subunit RPN8/RPN11